MMAALLTITAGAADVGAVVIARHRAQAAADMAALAAATVMPAGVAAACAQASAVAARMGTAATGCAPDGLDVVVTVEAQPALTRWVVGPARAVARAGPVITDGA